MLTTRVASNFLLVPEFIRHWVILARASQIPWVNDVRKYHASFLSLLIWEEHPFAAGSQVEEAETDARAPTPSFINGCSGDARNAVLPAAFSP